MPTVCLFVSKHVYKRVHMFFTSAFLCLYIIVCVCSLYPNIFSCATLTAVMLEATYTSLFVCYNYNQEHDSYSGLKPAFQQAKLQR